MELTIVLILVFILWTNETLFPKKPPKKPVEEQLADAIKDYLKEGIQVRIKGGKD
ncbi:MAG: hypothetical protein WBA99_01955 [Nodosilinea sp.]